MSFTEEQLKDMYEEIEEMAGLFFSPEDIAINLGFSDEWTEEFIHNIENRNVHAALPSAYFKGRLTAEIELRKSIKQSSINGSSPSQQMMVTFERQSRR